MTGATGVGPYTFNFQLSTFNYIMEVYAAIALALHEFYGNNAHDEEPGIITIRPKCTQWHSHLLTMRHSKN